MDLDGRTRQFFSVLSERLKEKGFSSRIADDGCLAVKSKKMRGKEQTQCSVGKDGEVYCRSVDFANTFSEKRLGIHIGNRKRSSLRHGTARGS